MSKFSLKSYLAKRKNSLSIFGINRFNDWFILFFLIVFLLICFFIAGIVEYKKVQTALHGAPPDLPSGVSNLNIREVLNKIEDDRKANARSTTSSLYIDPRI